MSSIRKAVARAIAEIRGDDFDLIPLNKSVWLEKQGMFQGRFRDVNEPFQCDYLEMADVAGEKFVEVAAEQGWTMRPDEATEDMIIAAGPAPDYWVENCYSAMQAAAPKFELDG